MSSLPFVAADIAALKKLLRVEFPEVRSAHLSEALAFAMGFRTHASMLAALKPHQAEPDFIWLDDEAFDKRLNELGYLPDLGFGFDQLSYESLLATQAGRAWEIEYRSARDQAWRNLMVETANEGLKRKLFSLRPDDNRWDGWIGGRHPDSKQSCEFDFTLSNGLPAAAYVADAGFGELAIHVAVVPTERGKWWLSDYSAGFKAGDAFGATWLERERGAWIQSSTDSFRCRKALVGVLATINPRPLGFGDRGRVIL